MGSAKKVLLLGGTGAMGVYLVPELIKLGYQVSVTSRSERKSDNQNLTFIKGDAKNDVFLKSILKKDKKYDAIIDFMVYHTDEFKNRVDLLLSSTNHYVFLSSYRVYADSETPIVESSARLLDVSRDQDYLKTDEYALTKARQENILKESSSKHWTVVRPAITYSEDRFQLGTMEANEFLHRALSGKQVIFPQEMLGKKTTMSWAGDVAKMIARIVTNENTHGEVYTVSTSESHTWQEVIDIYKKIINLQVKVVSLSDYKRVIGRVYQIVYDRMFDRVIDNKKILSATKMKQSELMSLEDGLRLELSRFIKSPKFNYIDKRKDREIDNLISPSIRRRSIRSIASSVKSKLKRIKRFIRSKQEYDGAILSLGGYYNYGGLIQRYALQKFLRKNGYNFKVFKVSYMDKYGKKVGDRSNLERFAKKHMDEEHFHPWLGGFYKAYIVGSDQVWRDFHGGNWEHFSNFFLRFVKNPKAKKIAYAASFGVDDLVSAGINARNRRRIGSLLKKFNSISVREKSAEKLVKQLKSHATTSLDPTMLLTKDDYSSIIDSFSDSTTANEVERIFTYLLDPTDQMEAFVKKLEKTKKANSTNFRLNNNEQLPPMELWLKGFRDSDIVVTDSFHGIVFSIINQKQFIAFGNKNRGMSRMTDLLGPLGLSDRIFTNESIDSIDIKEVLEPIDWEKVYSVLDKKRKQSGEWLLDALSHGH